MEDNIRLMQASTSARNDLRLVVLPKLEQIARLISGNPEAAKLLEAVRATTLNHTDGLSAALKCRTHRPSGREKDLPSWTRRTSLPDP